jgi:tripartite-type tricarboxylate transporter receptor subunit TctC
MRVHRSLLLLALFAPLAVAQTSAWPTKPVRMIVPFPPGGSTDVVSRILGQRLAEGLGQTLVIDNRGGAGGNIGTDLAAKSAPDGYTILMGTVTMSINPFLYPKMSHDVLRDLAPVSVVASAPQVLVVHPSFPAKTVKDVIDFAKAKPGAVNFGSSGNGTSGHLGIEMMKAATGIQVVHVPYKGAAPAMTDLLAGQVQVMFETITTAIPQLKAGKIRGIAVAASKRSTLLPELPPMTETIPGLDTTSWYGLMVPAGTPKAVISRLYAETAKALAVADVRERYAALGTEPVGSSPEEFDRYLRAEMAKWSKVIKQAGVKLE